MAKQTINLGSGDSRGDGESIRTAFDKCNDNFSELYTSIDNAFDGAYSSLTGKPTIPADVSDLTDTTNLLDHFSGDYNDLTNKPTIPTVPTTVSSFTNDAGYLTSFTETNDLSAAVTWANVPDANITESSVTQHQAALTITESQISDLSHNTYTAGSGLNLVSGEFSVATALGSKTFTAITTSGNIAGGDTSNGDAPTSYTIRAGNNTSTDLFSASAGGALTIQGGSSLMNQGGALNLLGGDGSQDGNVNIGTSHTIAINIGTEMRFGDYDGVSNKDSAVFGDGLDLRIYHDGTDSWITDNNGSGTLNIATSQLDILGGNDGAETMATFVDNGAVTLYYDNGAKIATTSAGVTVTGEVTTTGGNSTNWQTAYSWGDHSSAGYLTSETFTSLAQDTTPQLGGNLDLNSSNITGTGDISITGSATFTDAAWSEFVLHETNNDTAGRFIALSGNVYVQAGASGSGKASSSGNLIFTGYNNENLTSLQAKFGGSNVDIATVSTSQTFTNKSGNISQWTNDSGYVESDTTGITGADQVTNIVTLTQAEYDAIGSPNASTVYIIVG